MRVMIVWCILNVDIKLPNIACMVYHNYLSLPLGWATCSATSPRCCLGSLVVFVLQVTLKHCYPKKQMEMSYNTLQAYQVIAFTSFHTINYTPKSYWGPDSCLPQAKTWLAEWNNESWLSGNTAQVSIEDTYTWCSYETHTYGQTGMYHYVAFPKSMIHH